MKKLKRIAALIGACLLILMYLLTLVFALMHRPDWFQWFEASIFCTVAVPAVLYGMILIYKVLGHKKED